MENFIYLLNMDFHAVSTRISNDERISVKLRSTLENRSNKSVKTNKEIMNKSAVFRLKLSFLDVSGLVLH